MTCSCVLSGNLVSVDASKWFQLHYTHQALVSCSTLVSKFKLVLGQSTSISISNNTDTRCEHSLRSAGLGTEVTKKFQTWNNSWPYMLKSAIIPVMMLDRWLYPQIIRCHLWITNTEEPGHVCDKVKAYVPQTQSPLYFPVVSTNQILRYVAPAQCPHEHNAICIVKITLYS